MNKNERDTAFQFTVLQALWCIILMQAGGKPSRSISNIRSQMLAFGDEYGNQSEGSKEYRREVSYPDYPWSR